MMKPTLLLPALLLAFAYMEAAEPTRPALPAVDLRTLAGQDWNVKNQRGRVVIMGFWSLNCAPCLKMVPKIRRLKGEWKDREDIELVGVPTDSNLVEIRRHIKRHRLTWPQLVDKKGSALQVLGRPLGIDSMPTPNFWIIDVDGMIAGATTDIVKARRAAEQLALNAKAKKETKD